MTANITTPYSEKIPMFFGLCSYTFTYDSKNEDIKTFLNKKFNNEHTQNLSSIIDKLIDKGFTDKDFKNALFCTEYNKNRYLPHSNIFKHIMSLCAATVIIVLISGIISQSAADYLSKIDPFVGTLAMVIMFGISLLSIYQDCVSVYHQNISRLNELNSFFKSQNPQFGSSDDIITNSITNDNL